MVEILQSIMSNKIGNVLLMSTMFGLISFIGLKITIYIINKISSRVDTKALHWNILRYFAKIAWALIFILGLIETVPYFNNIGTALVACSSVLVAAIGLASQNVLKDAIDGVVISLFKPFSVGDRVRLVSRDITGTIEDINLRFTSIKTVENNLLMVPNSVMNDEIIENSNIIDTRIKAFIDVEVGYNSDIDLVKSTLRGLAVAHPLFVDNRTEEDKEGGKHPVSVLVRGFNSSGIAVRMTVCSANINDSFQLCSDLREEIIKEFRKVGIEIPYQTIEVYNHG